MNGGDWFSFRRISGILCFLFFSFFPLNTHAQSHLSLAEYRVFLDTVSGRLSHAIESGDFERAEKVLKDLPASIVVETAGPDGKKSEVDVSQEWLRTYFEHQRAVPFSTTISSGDTVPGAESIARNAMEVIQWESDALADEMTLDDTQEGLREDVAKILSDDVYEMEEEEVSSGDNFSWFQQFIGTAGKYLEWIVMFSVLALVAWLIWRFSRFLDFRKVAAEANLPSGVLVSENDPKNSAGLAGLAEAEADAGRFSAAVRYYYLALILLLHEKSLVPYNPSLTNWEYLRILVARNFHPETARLLTSLFDSSHYGFKIVSKEEFELFKSGWMRFTQGVPPGK